MKSIILVVDADASMRGIIRDVLSNRGYEVETASTVAEGLAVLDRVAPQLIFIPPELEDGTAMDIGMAAAGRGIEALLVLLVDGGDADYSRLVDEFEAFTYLTRPVERKRLEFIVNQGQRVRERFFGDRRREHELTQVRHFLGAMLGAGDAAVFLLDEDGVILEANPAGVLLLEAGNGSVEGRRYLSLLSGSSVEAQENLMAHVREDLRPQRLEERFGGAVLDTLISPVLEGRCLVGMVVTTRDITAQRQSEGRSGRERKALPLRVRGRPRRHHPARPRRRLHPGLQCRGPAVVRLFHGRDAQPVHRGPVR